MFNHQYGVSTLAELTQCTQQHAVITRVQANCRFIKHITYARKVGAERGRQPNALRLSTGEGRRRSIKLEVAKPHPLEKAQTSGQLLYNVACYSELPLTSKQLRELPLSTIYAVRSKLCNAVTCKTHKPRLGTQARPLAVGAQFRLP